LALLPVGVHQDDRHHPEAREEHANQGRRLGGHVLLFGKPAVADALLAQEQAARLAGRTDERQDDPARVIA
jgi:hypothetical protein